MRRRDPRGVLFDLGDFTVDREVADLLPFAEVRRLVARHAWGDWGNVSAERRRMNDAFAHPKNRSTNASARSVHVIGNVQVCLLTRQGKGRRQTHLFLL